jgi:hypothetical protein
MKRLHLILIAAVFSTLATGCMVSGTMRTRAYVSQPELVYVSPGVEVIADYDEPVFYSDGYYWRWYGNTWYRSSVHTGGWVRWRNVPHAVVTINNPHGYVHYRGNGRVRRQEVRDHRRDVRQDRREVRQERRQDVRDHRQDVREDKREKRQDKREDKRDHRQDKREEKQDRIKVHDHRH